MCLFPNKDKVKHMAWSNTETVTKIHTGHRIQVSRCPHLARYTVLGSRAPALGGSPVLELSQAPAV